MSRNYNDEEKFGNFKTAFRELMNGSAPIEEEYDETESWYIELESTETDTQKTPPLKPSAQEETAQTIAADTLPEKELSSHLNSQLFQTEETQYINHPAMNNTRTKTIISKDVILSGDIKSKGDIDVNGTIEGNVAAEGNVLVNGTITGNLAANSICLEKGILSGDFIQARSHISIRKGFKISGQIQAKSMEISGKIAGNITASGLITLNSTANISGDISAQFIAVEKGALINGSMRIIPE